MILYTPKNAYAVHFIHYRTLPSFPREVREAINKMPLRIATKIDAVTVCTIHEGPCKVPSRPCETPNTLMGIAFKVRKDSFEHSKGRKVALAKAMATLPKAIRTALWRGYLLKTHVIGTVHPQSEPKKKGAA